MSKVSYTSDESEAEFIDDYELRSDVSYTSDEAEESWTVQFVNEPVPHTTFSDDANEGGTEK